MADKMMRIAGRSEDGLAKPIKANKEGNLSVEKATITLMKEAFSSQGRTLAAREDWESPAFETGGKNELLFFTSLGSNNLYTVHLVESIGQSNRTVRQIAPDKFQNNLSGSVKVYSPNFKIRVTNQSDIPLDIGLSLYLK